MRKWISNFVSFSVVGLAIRQLLGAIGFRQALILNITVPNYPEVPRVVLVDGDTLELRVVANCDFCKGETIRIVRIDTK